jgi:hypothetical protein
MVAIFNETYDEYGKFRKTSETNCLRRAWKVNVGNDDLAAGKPHKAGEAMKNKRINFLAYDTITNAFAFNLNDDPPANPS